MIATFVSAGGAVALTLAMCGPAAAGPTTPAAAGPSGAALLASRTTAGGLCRSGPCGSRLVVRSTGAWTLTSTGASTAREAGTLTTRQLRLVRAAVATTRLASSAPFTGTCPTAYDGTEVTYRWRAGDGWRHVSSCEREIPRTDPLVRALAGITADQG